MKFNRSKKTKRFSFGISRNTTSHKAGANTFTISTEGYTRAGVKGYASGTTDATTVTMTVKEAQALQGFLNKHLTNSTASSTSN